MVPTPRFELLQVPLPVAESVVVAPTQTVVVPVIPPDGVSLMVTGVAKFQRSPGSSLELWFTAFSTPYSTTDPVPADGAVHEIVST
jgi:hypothetical protein